MTYCTAQDLTDRFGEAELIQCTDRDNLGSVDYAVLEQAISDATAEINGYLTAYLPLATIPANLVRMACDITRFYLYDDNIIDPVQTRYDNAVKYLAQVAKGTIALAPGSTGDTIASTQNSVEFTSNTAVFGSNGGGY